MANQQHIEWLMEGVDAWNARRERDNFQPDFAGANLREMFETAGKLGDDARTPRHKANLQEANLRESDLRWANLREADLQGANLREADLQRANLREAVLQRAQCKGAEKWRKAASLC